MHKKSLLLLVFLSLIFAPAALAQTDSPDTFWWNDRVFYQLFVRSFYDSDGDGIGDFQGIIEKLDYLNDGDPATTTDLGITGIWLMPIMPSPGYHGYDVTDYYSINPAYGTKEDFQAFMTAAHERGIAVIIDLVLNHTSSQHPWFLASQDGDEEYADWYIWSDTNPNYRGPDNQTVWHPKKGRYYYGLFWSEMPDLNYTNPNVTAQMYDVSRFWLEEMQVDGFRMDAVKYFVEEGRAGENTRANHDWLKAYHDYVRSINPDALLVGEIWEGTGLVAPYVGGEMDLAFEFDLAKTLIRSASFGLPGVLRPVINLILSSYPAGQYATFLANHDQDRTMSQLRGNLNGAKLGAYMQLTLPGVPFIYYGEEIGMTGRRTLSDTDAERRSPMQWDASDNAGFTGGTPWFEVNDEYTTVNVETQADDSASLLNVYRDMIQLRNNNEALQHGDFTLLLSASKKVLAFIRHSEEQTALVIINMDDRPVTDYALTLDASALTSVSDAALLYGEGEISAPTLTDAGGFEGYSPLAELAPFSITVIELLP